MVVSPQTDFTAKSVRFCETWHMCYFQQNVYQYGEKTKVLITTIIASYLKYGRFFISLCKKNVIREFQLEALSVPHNCLYIKDWPS